MVSHIPIPKRRDCTSTPHRTLGHSLNLSHTRKRSVCCDLSWKCVHSSLPEVTIEWHGGSATEAASLRDASPPSHIAKSILASNVRHKDGRLITRFLSPKSVWTKGSLYPLKTAKSKPPSKRGLMLRKLKGKNTVAWCCIFKSPQPVLLTRFHIQGLAFQLWWVVQALVSLSFLYFVISTTRCCLFFFMLQLPCNDWSA